MTTIPPSRLIAFSSGKCIAAGPPSLAISRVKSFQQSNPEADLLVLDAESSRVVELDTRKSVETLLTSLGISEEAARQAAQGDRSPSPRPRGRPRLGVVSREVTLLPRHWDWLGSQPGGASVALRKLVETASRANRDKDLKRAAQDSAYRFMTVLAGDEPGYEEAIRALYAGDLVTLNDQSASWPADVRRHALQLAQEAI